MSTRYPLPGGPAHLTRIRVLMAERRVNQTQLAKLLGLSQASTSRKLAGLTEFRIAELITIAAAFDVNVSQLLDSNAA